MTDQSRKELIIAALRDSCCDHDRHPSKETNYKGWAGPMLTDFLLADAFAAGDLLIVDRADLQSARDAIAPDEHGENDGARNELDRILAGNGTEKETKK